MPKPKPTVHFAGLCDDVREEVNGKASLLGIFTDFYVSDYQKPLPKFTVHLRLGFKDPGSYAVNLEIRSHEGDFSMGMQGNIEALANENEAYNQYLVNLNFIFDGLKIPREGLYHIDVKVDGRPISLIPLMVSTRKPPVVQ
jgi:hypothetical protein